MKALPDDEKGAFFQIDRIAIQNFRCFPDLTIELNTTSREITLCGKSKTVAPLTVIVAKNGMGKTTVLDAIRIAYGTYTSGFNYKSSVTIQQHDIRIEKDNSKQCFPVSVDTFAEIGYSWAEWIRAVNNEGQRPRIYQRKDINQQIKHYDGNPFKHFTEKVKTSENKEEWPLPIIASYGTNRLWKKTNRKDKKRNLVTNRTWGYSSCLDAASSYSESFEWMTDAIIVRLNENQVGIQKNQVINDQLEAIESALKTVLESEGYTPPLHLDPFFQELAVVQGKEWGKGVSVPVSQMSDGVRAVFFMVADIVFRCAKLNPQFKEKAAEQTPGIVLIDEVDLHLHPSWQQKVLDTLQYAFPKIQFIVTTHSPQVVSSVPGECVRVIAGGRVFDASIKTDGARADQVLEDVFGVKARYTNSPVYKYLEEFQTLLENGEWNSERGRELYSKLHQTLSTDPIMAEFAMRIHLKEYQRRHNEKN